MSSYNEKKLLHICTTFFSYLNSQNVRYCHWKSNSHLDEALAGETDLDLLIHKADRALFTHALEKFNFKKIISPPEKSYPGIEDYLGFDYNTGKLIHLHNHYKLILGEKHVKNYHLTIEELVLGDLRLLFGVYVPSYEVELLLLIIRANMKLGLRSVIKYIIKANAKLYPADINNEFVFLLINFNEEKFKNILFKSQLPLSEKKMLSFINKVKKGELALEDVIKIRMHVFGALKSFRRFNSLVCFLRRCVATIRSFPIIRKFYKTRKKILYKEGKVLAFVGADGSGKSTLVQDLEKWLSWKLKVRKFYFGIPKSLNLKIIAKIIRWFGFLKEINICKVYCHVMEYIEKQMSAYRWLYIAKKRYDIYKKTQYISVNKGIAITDRYSLSVFYKMKEPMDGPRIRNEFCGISNRLSEYEERYYSVIGLPSMVFVLQTSLDELRKRKSDTEIKRHTIKASLVSSIKDSHNFYTINGNRSYSDVLLELKRKIWELL